MRHVGARPSKAIKMNGRQFGKDSLTDRDQAQTSVAAYVRAARLEYQDDDININIDDDAAVSVSDEGAWVQGWLWVPVADRAKG